MARAAKVLCIDDDPTQLGIRKLMLEGYGYQVVTSTSPQAGLKLLEREEADIVLTDYQMPEMDGAHLAAEIKRQHPAMPVMMISSFPWVPEDAEPYIDGFVSKSLPIKSVVERMEQVLTQVAQPQPAANDLLWLGSAMAGATALGFTYYRLRRAFRPA